MIDKKAWRFPQGLGPAQGRIKVDEDGGWPGDPLDPQRPVDRGAGALGPRPRGEPGKAGLAWGPHFVSEPGWLARPCATGVLGSQGLLDKSCLPRPGAGAWTLLGPESIRFNPSESYWSTFPLAVNTLGSGSPGWHRPCAAVQRLQEYSPGLWEFAWRGVVHTLPSLRLLNICLGLGPLNCPHRPFTSCERPWAAV